MLEISQAVQERFQEEDDEARRLHEGVHALLNLASSGGRQVTRSDVGVSTSLCANIVGDRRGVKKSRKAKINEKGCVKAKTSGKLNLNKKSFVKKTELKSALFLVSAVTKKLSCKIVNKNITNKSSNSAYKQKQASKVPGIVSKGLKERDTLKVDRLVGTQSTRRSNVGRLIVPLDVRHPAKASKLSSVNSSKRVVVAEADLSQFRRSCRKRKGY